MCAIQANSVSNPPQVAPWRLRVCVDSTEMTLLNLLIRGKLTSSAARNNLSGTQHVGAIRQRQGRARILFDEKDRQPGIAELADRFEDSGDDKRREPERWLIQHAPASDGP